MPISINGKNYDIAYGTIPIEKMGGFKLTYSMYGDEIPIKDESGNVQGSLQVSSDHSVYLKTNGELYVVGSNQYGQIGLPEGTTEVLEFTKVAENVKYVKAFDSHTFYIDKSNNLYATGYNNFGQLGIGDITDRYGFVKVGNYPDIKRIYQMKDAYVSYMLMENGDVFVAGEKARINRISEITYDNNVTTWVKLFSNVKDFCGQYDSLLYIDNNDNLYGVGFNYNYSFGDGTNTASKTPVLIKENVEKVDYYNSSTIMIKTKDNQLYMTGSSTKDSFNKDGRILFVCDNVKDYIPASSFMTAWARDNDNNLYGGGQNSAGNMGSGTTANPIGIAKRASDVLSYHMGGLNSWYIDINNDLYGCGTNTYGAQGAGKTSSSVTKWTKRASNVKQVYACQDNTFYLTFEGNLYVCGSVDGGLLGGIASSNLASFKLLASNVKRILQLDWEAETIIYETNDNKLFGTGQNYYGVYGLSGNAYNSTTRTLVEVWGDTTKIKEIIWLTSFSDGASSGYCSYIVTTNNEIYCTGNNSGGGFATGSKTSTGQFVKMNLPE